MSQTLQKNWWKFLSVIIIVYALVVGMLTPLKPNLTEVFPAAAPLGETTTFELTGYNTRFTEEEGQTRAWLRYGDGLAVAAEAFEPTGERTARATFTLPGDLPEDADGSRGLSMIVSGPVNGAFVVPGAVTVRAGTNNDAAAGETAWARDALVAGDLVANPNMTFPYRALLGETIRNTYFHVSLWFAMMFLFIGAVVQSVKALRHRAGVSLEAADRKALSLTAVGTLFGVLGLLTGAVWARYTWGSFWSWDIKQFTTLIALLIYGGYFLLRAPFKDTEQRGRIAAAYNIFAFVCLIPLIYVLPRLSATSLHPGAEGNPAMGGEDLDNTMRMVFYPIIIGWTLFGFWMAQVGRRIHRLKDRLWAS